MSKVFRFQQFNVVQAHSAMKVGTDGVLLGAWAPGRLTDTHALDIGTGTGLIALMLAQRFSKLKIDAVEIDDAAAQEAKINFSQSPWEKRLAVHHASFSTFVATQNKTYDLIVCNPPFFSSGSPKSITQRTQARQAFFLPFDSLIEGVHRLLAEEGLFALVLPSHEAQRVTEIALQYSLYTLQKTEVLGHANAQIKRNLLCFSRKKTKCVSKQLILEHRRHERTKEHQSLVQAFYLPKH